MDPFLKAKLTEVEALARADDYTGARQLVAELITEYPGEAWVWATNAYVEGRGRNYQDALAHWSKAIELCKNEPHLFYSRGLLFIRLGQYKEAVADFTKVIELSDLYDSNYYREPAHFCRADAYVRLREFDKARSDCSHVKDGERTWTDRLRSKEDILAECDSPRVGSGADPCTM